MRCLPRACPLQRRKATSRDCRLLPTCCHQGVRADTLCGRAIRSEHRHQVKRCRSRIYERMRHSGRNPGDVGSLDGERAGTRPPTSGPASWPTTARRPYPWARTARGPWRRRLANILEMLVTLGQGPRKARTTAPSGMRAESSRRSSDAFPRPVFQGVRGHPARLRPAPCAARFVVGFVPQRRAAWFSYSLGAVALLFEHPVDSRCLFGDRRSERSLEARLLMRATEHVPRRQCPDERHPPECGWPRVGKLDVNAG